MERAYPLMANVMRFLHFAFTAFVVIGPVVVFIGRRKRWEWVRSFWFRGLHLGSIMFVLGESILAVECPLTVWEHWFRRRAGQEVRQTEFISYWTQEWFGFATPPWTLTVIFSVFAAFVLWTWWKVPPEPPLWEVENASEPTAGSAHVRNAGARDDTEPNGTREAD